MTGLRSSREPGSCAEPTSSPAPAADGRTAAVQRSAAAGAGKAKQDLSVVTWVLNARVTSSLEKAVIPGIIFRKLLEMSCRMMPNQSREIAGFEGGDMFPRICTTMAVPPRQPPVSGSAASSAKEPSIIATQGPYLPRPLRSGLCLS